ncbi:hypothetical protein SBOR_9544 [Sclerotinia borealis F-4128]|uniref:Uncharacterized protein n=1 Tax=Sclerotinia borealis (strain F-4128) TaxID=1432307 RepID=W9C677_SCLBF|nr:hypothetical protein SBOR_9544 [Sclerotinia borealis F-4128]
MAPKKNLPLTPSKEPKDAQKFRITFRSHVFEIHRYVAVNASELFAKLWQDRPASQKLNFNIEKDDGDDNDPHPENFYTVDAMAQLIAYLYCKVYNFASYLGMPRECERSLDRFRTCLYDRKYNHTIPTAEEVVSIYDSTKRDSKVCEILVGAMTEMWHLVKVNNHHSGDLGADANESWHRSLKAVPEFEKAVMEQIGRKEIESGGRRLRSDKRA